MFINKPIFNLFKIDNIILIPFLQQLIIKKMGGKKAVKNKKPTDENDIIYCFK